MIQYVLILSVFVGKMSIDKDGGVFMCRKGCI